MGSFATSWDALVGTQTPPKSRSQRRVITAKVPQMAGKTKSQMAIDDIQGSKVNQGTSAPMANDWMSPRPKIAAITNGVGRTQQTLTKNKDPMKSRNDDAIPKRIATTATAINIQARLNWKRGSGNQRRAERVEGVSGSGIFHSTAGRLAQKKQSNHTIGPTGLPNNGLIYKRLRVGGPLRRCRQVHPRAGDKFLRGFSRLELGDSVLQTNL
jgi:hypothetical protein